MKRSVALRKKLENLKNQIKTLQDENKITEAHNMLNELNEVKKELEVTEMLEEEENKSIQDNQGLKAVNQKVDKRIIFNKLVLGKELTQAELDFQNQVGATGQVESVDARGGYLVPVEQAEEIKIYMRGLGQLKDYCNVVKVTSKTGTMPIEVEGAEELINFDEISEINQSDFKFAQVKWNVGDYGDIVPISNTLLDDINVDLVGYVKHKFGRKATKTENKKILEIIKGVSTTVTGKDHKAITTALNTKLNSAISAQAVILCNQTSFDFLDNLEDKNGRPILSIDIQDETKRKYKGREIIVVDDADLTGGTTKDFYVGSIEELISFFDREQITMAISKEAGFTKNVTYIKVIERFDVKKVDDKAMVKVAITPTA